jgi:hypothetical protein
LKRKERKKTLKGRTKGRKERNTLKLNMLSLNQIILSGLGPWSIGINGPSCINVGPCDGATHPKMEVVPRLGYRHFTVQINVSTEDSNRSDRPPYEGEKNKLPNNLTLSENLRDKILSKSLLMAFASCKQPVTAN